MYRNIRNQFVYERPIQKLNTYPILAITYSARQLMYVGFR